MFLYRENDANLAIPGENLSAKRKHLTQVKFMKVTSCLEIFYEEFKKQYIGRKLNFLYTLLFCFEILLSDEEFSSFEVLKGKWWLHIKVQLLQ